MSLVSRYDFQKCVDRYKGDWHAKTLTCIDQFKIMSFAQFTGRSSLRDIEMKPYMIFFLQNNITIVTTQDSYLIINCLRVTLEAFSNVT